MDMSSGGGRARTWRRPALYGVIERLRPSDGRIKVATLTGVSLAVALVALLIGVLPAIADAPGVSGAGVNPAVVSYGGGSGACGASIPGRLPSAAGLELHINNPGDGTFTGPDGTEIRIDVHPVGAGDADMYFDFEVLTEGKVVYDVVVNGGSQNTHYDYDGNGGPGTVTSDTHLHPPAKGGSGKVFNLSHVNVCYDVPGVTLFTCGTPVTLTGEGLFTIAEASIFANSVHDCTDKRASFLIDNDAEPPAVTLAFEGDGTDTVAGRLDITKNFEDPSTFEALEYDGSGDFVDVQWCEVRTKVGADGNEFDDVLATTQYPSLVGVTDGETQATACKVYEEEDATGVQFTVVYFEFVDPQFR